MSCDDVVKLLGDRQLRELLVAPVTGSGFGFLDWLRCLTEIKRQLPPRRNLGYMVSDSPIH
jgi:hypothetical protein